MSGPAIFFDTNVLFYLLSSDEAKANRTEELLSRGGIISVQVLNEFAAVAVRKLKMSWSDIKNILSSIRAVCRVVPLTVQLHDDGMTMAGRYNFSIYDSLIIAAALHSDCELLYSEDLQDGQKFGRLTICNPFKDLLAA